ncbi:P-type DNA transfer ATPase VirB11 [Sphingomonas flavescens]|uniref:P-type DNA transfer ATPase VirB11 n=1 Tax=Sphingomonas flavescens TaxID=3132797 RepID=UPI002805E4A0|nr:P-type DNA transfer ATPase VirB11 [Sphingomonas limnosediminicola]
MSVTALPTNRRDGIDPFLDAYLEPFRAWLAQDDVTEILVNRPGEVWVEQRGKMTRHASDKVDDNLLQRLAEQVARVSNQGISRERPLLAAMLPNGARVQFVAPTATRAHWALAMRRHCLLDLPLDAYATGPLKPQAVETKISAEEDPVGFLRQAVKDRKTILISGGTSTGKTTFLNAMLREVPVEQRVIVVEDTAEVQLHGPNDLGLIAVKGELGEALINTDDLLQAALRLRPDRILLGELRGKEAVSFLRAVNTGHPGSFSTIHANSTSGALEQLSLMVMQSGLGLSRSETIEYARSVIDVVVQLGRDGPDRKIVAIDELAAA